MSLKFHPGKPQNLTSPSLIHSNSANSSVLKTPGPLPTLFLLSLPSNPLKLEFALLDTGESNHDFPPSGFNVAGPTTSLVVDTTPLKDPGTSDSSYIVASSKRLVELGVSWIWGAAPSSEIVPSGILSSESLGGMLREVGTLSRDLSLNRGR